ncbi:uncharacterized protein TM35_000061620 [Trypanosoma theileri]|uniref:Uncharacterized protein n=1 Tax=Trypanosoma theileri TaxID=67003 RepID=A0A1X0P2J8_9TRYP|nr:uncharacterized protein TM35_000061620 [Trypanosoma theileri]ORC91157.1 hypothetical protein TM35_000061620 [Trypanosoma theileri]
MQSEITSVSEGSYGVSSQTPIIPQDDESNPARGVIDGCTGKGNAAVQESKLSNNVSGSRDKSEGAQRSDREKNVLPPTEVPGSSEITLSNKGYTFTSVKKDSTYAQECGDRNGVGIIGDAD